MVRSPKGMETALLYGYTSKLLLSKPGAISDKSTEKIWRNSMKELFKKFVGQSKLYYFALTLFAIIFAFSCYMIGSQMLASAKSEKEYHSIQETYYSSTEYLDEEAQNKEDLLQEEETVEEKTEILPRFHSLLEQNSDTVGWIHIPNTVIDYPIVQADDNTCYLDHTFEMEKNKAGSIFMDYRNSVEELDQNTIIYGHHMKDGSMFKGLAKFRNEDFLLENKKIVFNSIYEEMEWEIFAVFVTDTDFNYIEPNFSTEDEFQEFIEMVKLKSIIPLEYDITQEDHILTLSTCGYDFDDARIVVQAKLLND